MSERQVFKSLEDALRTFPSWPAANLEVIRETTADLEISLIYTPPKRSYIGLVLEDGGPIVAIAYGWIWGLRTADGAKGFVALPDNRLRDGGYTQGGEPDQDPCPNCGIILPNSGLCGHCY